MGKHATVRESGGSLWKFGNLEATRLLLRHSQYDAGPMTEFHMHDFLAVTSFTTLVSTFWLFANFAYHTLHRWGLRDYNRSFNRKVVEERLGWVFFCTVHIAQVLACHLCARGTYVGIYRAMGLNDNAKQAIGERKKWSSWKRTKWTGGYGPAYCSQLSLTCMSLCYT